MVVADPVLVARRRPGGLDAPEEALVGEDAERVVDGLARDGADLGPHDLVDVVGGAVRPVGHRPQHGQPLGRDLQAVLAEERIDVDGGSGARGTVGSLNPNIGVSPDLAECQFSPDPGNPRRR